MAALRNGEFFACRDPKVLFTEDEVFVPSVEAKKVSVKVGDTLCLV